MRVIYNTSTEPAFNLAAEEWLLHNTSDDVFMLWRNANAVIVGRNQNTLSEINEQFVRERGISVIRRLTGGGAVFHDLGNINFTFISLGNNLERLDMRKFAQPIVEALNSMGVPCEFNGRNDLVIGDRKISGNAQHVFRNRVLHHGTLLFASQMADLSGALKLGRAKYSDRAVKSVRSRVTNISEHLPEPMDAKGFIKYLMARVTGSEADAYPDFLPREQEAIRELVREKYGTWEWNYGRSPKYDFSRSSRTAGGVLDVHMNVRDGVISDIRIFGDYFGIRDVSELEESLRDCRHQRDVLAAKLAEIPLQAYLQGVSVDEFLDCLF